MDVRFSFSALIDISGYNHAEVLIESHFAIDHSHGHERSCCAQTFVSLPRHSQFIKVPTACEPLILLLFTIPENEPGNQRFLRNLFRFMDRDAEGIEFATHTPHASSR